MTIETADKVIRFLEKYNSAYRDMVAFLTEKQAKVMADDLLWLLDSVEDEQALVMKIQSEENARTALFEELELGEIKAKELIEDAPDERKSKLTLLYDELTGYVAKIKQLNNIIVETVEKKLSVQEELMRKTGMTLTETYNGYGAKIKHTSAPKGFIGNI
ncbi:MAG: flagellar export chaperone FlgN [Ruminiclostridium sp.]|nr:flagellar export chaperone FlgN [Ruminiclostridium sp.]